MFSVCMFKLTYLNALEKSTFLFNLIRKKGSLKIDKQSLIYKDELPRKIMEFHFLKMVR